MKSTKPCIFHMDNNYCVHRRLKVDCKGHYAKTKTKARVKCRFKDKTQCAWYKGCEQHRYRSWKRIKMPLLLTRYNKDLNTSRN